MEDSKDCQDYPTGSSVVLSYLGPNNIPITQVYDHMFVEEFGDVINIRGRKNYTEIQENHSDHAAILHLARMLAEAKKDILSLKEKISETQADISRRTSEGDFLVLIEMKELEKLRSDLEVERRVTDRLNPALDKAKNLLLVKDDEIEKLQDEVKLASSVSDERLEQRDILAKENEELKKETQSMRTTFRLAYESHVDPHEKDEEDEDLLKLQKENEAWLLKERSRRV